METTREPTTYVLLRVTFGDKPSPDMASFVMLKMAREHKESAPEASEIIEREIDTSTPLFTHAHRQMMPYREYRMWRKYWTQVVFESTSGIVLQNNCKLS